MKDLMYRILESIDITTITLGRALTIIGASIGFALVIALVYFLTHRKTGVKVSVLMTMIILGPVVSVIVVCIGSNIARAISIGGGLALVRFRSQIENPSDLIYFFMSLASGMACGVGFIGFGAIAIGLILLTILLLNLLGIGRIGGNGMRLRVLVPESLNYTDVFEPVIKDYCKSYRRTRVRTQDYGTLIELEYTVCLKDASKEKLFLDALRERNGNLDISLTQVADKND